MDLWFSFFTLRLEDDARNTTKAEVTIKMDGDLWARRVAILFKYNSSEGYKKHGITVSLPVPSKYVHSGRKQTRESSREEELTRANGGLKIRCTGFAQVWYVRLLFIPGLRSEHHQICKTDFRVLSPSHYFNARRSKKTKSREIIRELLSDAGGEFSNS